MADFPFTITGDRFRSRRSVVMSLHGMVGASQPLAAQAGLRILLAGGNAADAAVATAAVLGVVEPMSTGIGGDAFALIYDAKTKQVEALNGSGRSPAALSLDALRERDLDAIPSTGMLSVTVPGTVDAWAELLRRHGTMSLAEVLQPAITYAREGFPVSELIGRAWFYETPRLRDHPDTVQTYLVDGQRAPHPGEVFRQANLARSLQLIADEGRDAFYCGSIAEAIVRISDQYGGLFSLQDFASHTSSWETPISVDYRGYTVYECPPNGQGLTALLALNILKGCDLTGMQPCSAELLHLQIDALRLAFADAGTYVADPQLSNIPLEALLSDQYASMRRAILDPRQALQHAPVGVPVDPKVAGGASNLPSGGNDTVYLTVVDEAGNAVSFINSVAAHFGSGVVAGQTGICLQNRATGFVLDPAHRNCLAPAKRPFHTIIPCMVLRDDQLWSSFGVMGGLMQPQGHVQVLMDMVDFGMNPQEAMDAPRFEIVPPWPDAVAIEAGIAVEERAKLEHMGHQVVPGRMFGFGGGQVIVVDPETGARHGGSEPRKDGCIVAY